MPFIYLIDYARHIGIEPKQGAYLLSIIGISNTGARVLCGYISDKSWADPLKIYNWALIIGGLSTISSAWLSSYALLSCYAVVFGLCVGKYYAATQTMRPLLLQPVCRPVARGVLGDLRPPSRAKRSAFWKWQKVDMDM